MKPMRTFLLLLSGFLVLFLLGGGLAVKVGAGESTYHQALVFSEVLSLVLDNYVDPVEAKPLLRGAYEGMLGGLDAHGAFLTPEEVAEWKTREEGSPGADAGITVLKAGHGLQVVAVRPGTPAADSGVVLGDQIRAIDERPIRDLSLGQAWALLRGAPGSAVTLDLLHPADGFRREQVVVKRTVANSPPHVIETRHGIAVLRLHDLARVDAGQLAAELEQTRDGGTSELLVDLRNLADFTPRGAARIAGLFVEGGPLLRLRDRSGRLVETLEVVREAGRAWPGEVSVLVNGATAGGAEALASLIHDRDGMVLGESTYGLGAEPKLYELEDGSGLVISAALWETSSGARWNASGLQPDHEVQGKGATLAEMSDDQLDRALSFLERREPRGLAGAGPTREAA
jgi:carboxyl-terminal processing protease